MDTLPDELIKLTLSFMCFKDAWRTGLTCRRAYAALQNAAPEVAGHWGLVPPRIPGESCLRHLAFVYSMRKPRTPCKLLATFDGLPLTYEGQPVNPGKGKAFKGKADWLLGFNVLEVAVSSTNSTPDHSNGLVLDTLGAVWEFGDRVVPSDDPLEAAPDTRGGFVRALEGAKLRRVQCPETCVSVTTSNQSSAALTATGELWVWGCNFGHKLGVGTAPGAFLGSPMRTLGLLEPIAQVALGHSHMAAVSRTGNVYGCGSNEQGQLGLGEDAPAGPFPVLIPLLVTTLDAAPPDGQVVRALQVATGQFHTLVLLSTGELVGSGRPYLGEAQFAHAPYFRSAFPQFHAPIAQVQCSRIATAFLTRQGVLHIAGYNVWGHVFTPEPVECVEPVASFHLTPFQGLTMVGRSGCCYSFIGKRTSPHIFSGPRPPPTPTPEVFGLPVVHVARSYSIFTACVRD